MHEVAQKKTGFSLAENGVVLSWLSPVVNEHIAYKYWEAHCDKANNKEYDFAALLYLNSEFTGGQFVLMDDHIDRMIEPTCGRLLIFKSSIENIHRVERVKTGDRLLLSAWYSHRSLLPVK
jgi:hypothetical protein